MIYCYLAILACFFSVNSFSSDVLEPDPQNANTHITKAPFDHDNHVQASAQDMLEALYAQPLPRPVMTHLVSFLDDASLFFLWKTQLALQRMGDEDMGAQPQDRQEILRRIAGSTHISHAVAVRYHPDSIPVYFSAQGGCPYATFSQENMTTLAKALSSPSPYCNLRLPDDEDRRPALLPLAVAIAQNKTCTTLKPHHEWFNGRTVPVLTTALKENNHLRTLSLNNNTLGDTGLYLLLGALLDHPLTKLSLEATGLTKESAPYLKRFLEKNATLTSLDVSFNKLGDAGMIPLSLALRQNSSLQRLGLAKNGITSQGAITLAMSSLAHNSTLTFVKLNTNRITDEGAMALFENSCEGLFINLHWNSGVRAKIQQHIEDSSAGRISFG